MGGGGEEDDGGVSLAGQVGGGQVGGLEAGGGRANAHNGRGDGGGGGGRGAAAGVGQRVAADPSDRRGVVVLVPPAVRGGHVKGHGDVVQFDLLVVDLPRGRPVVGLKQKRECEKNTKASLDSIVDSLVSV